MDAPLSGVISASFRPERGRSAISRNETYRARAPLRLAFAGGGTDLSPYSDVHGGAVLNATINRFAHASLHLTGGDRVVMRGVDLGCEEEEAVGLLPAVGRLSLHRAVYNRIVREFCGGRAFGATITTMIDAPPGSGLGSSSALVVALVDVFREALGLPLGRYDVAHIAFEIERVELALAGGKQDQYAASFGGVNFIEFLPSDRVIVSPLRVSSAILSELQASIVICFTGQSRASEDIIRDQVSSISESDPWAIENMHQLKSDAIEMKQALLRGDIRGMAEILDHSWQAKKATASGISNSLIESLWDVAHRNGALAGKISGAGGGGFLVFLVDPDERVRVMRALKEGGGTPDSISLAHAGVEAWSAGRGCHPEPLSLAPAS
jgi:D-glycero-alpha-D-manno-heptose-7-phosphate kinase